MKTKTEYLDKKDVVYSFPCQTCGLKYIGETSKTLKQRKEQHERDVRNKVTTNGMANHVKNRKQHRIGWEQGSIITEEQDWMSRKIKESIIIDCLNPKKEMLELMNLEKGINVSQCWLALAERLRTQLFGKS
jgi:predicted GIY-YIG superfamily endonuclease